MTSTNLSPRISFSGFMVEMYDRILGPSYFEPYAIETATRVASLKPQKVLETACGTGRVTNQLRKNLPPDVSIIATDLSPDMLAVAKSKLAGAAVSLLEADALNLPFEDSHFDVVVCQFGIMFFIDRKKGLEEAFRVLKNGGTLILSVWDKLELNPVAGAGRKVIRDFFEGNPPASMGIAFSMTDRDEIQTMLEECGFSDVKSEIVTKPCIAESAEDLATATIDGSTISQFLRDKDPEAIPVLRKQVADSIKEKFGDHPVRGTMQAIIFTATKEI